MTKRERALLDALRTYDWAAMKFIEKVDNGRARSVETYHDLKDALEKSRKVQRG
jgi:hypothetical protein